MCKLSVNINKIATLRNARGGNMPNLVKMAIDCQAYGAQGITIHPRPDERHIRYSDVADLKPVVKTEYNIEGYPSREFMDLVIKTKPEQVTLVPDSPGVLTSNAGWDTIAHEFFLRDTVAELKAYGIRTSIFIDTNIKLVENAIKTDTDRIELYTEAYAANYTKNREKAIKPYTLAAECAYSLNMGLNAGHDLSLENLHFFKQNIPHLLEVSIGHALICDALYYGLVLVE
jgi:pyridoxine 5-phosphate synthase